jgi:hypothetical protein
MRMLLVESILFRCLVLSGDVADSFKCDRHRSTSQHLRQVRCPKQCQNQPQSYLNTHSYCSTPRYSP